MRALVSGASPCWYLPEFLRTVGTGSEATELLEDAPVESADRRVGNPSISETEVAGLKSVTSRCATGQVYDRAMMMAPLFQQAYALEFCASNPWIPT